MKNGLIFTLYGNINYGNKLQNFAVQELLKNKNIESYTVVFEESINMKRIMKDFIKFFIPKYRKKIIKDRKRKKEFKKFDNNILKIKKRKINNMKIDYYFIGSDQVWNPNDTQSNKIVKFINEATVEKKVKTISISASIAAEDIPDTNKNEYIKHFSRIDYISVREEQAKSLIEKYTERQDVEVVLDPTMLVDIKIWKEYQQKPTVFDIYNKSNKKYVLLYFLGKINEERYDVINDFANKNGCEIINILDYNSPYYTCEPMNFLWLIDNASFVFTDSFHSCVFSILFKKKFIVFDRLGRTNNMSSRIKNLLDIFKLNNNIYNGSIDEKKIMSDYSSVNKIIKKEKEKFEKYLDEALNDK